MWQYWNLNLVFRIIISIFRILTLKPKRFDIKQRTLATKNLLYYYNFSSNFPSPHLERPDIVERPPDITYVSTGNPLILSCIANGNPPPTIEWSAPYDLTPFEVLKNGSLFVKEANPTHSGQFSCTASNSAGTDYEFFEVSVRSEYLLQPQNSFSY